MKAQQLDLFRKPPRTRAGRTRTYAVSVYGYGEVRYSALSAGKARAQAYRAFCDAITRKTFHWFLVNSRVWRVQTEGKGGAV